MNGAGQIRTTADLKQAVRRNLIDGIIPFWQKYSVDEENGGFYGAVANDGTPDKTAEKGVILTSRILWSFSRLYRFLGDTSLLLLADRAYMTLERHFRDGVSNGYFWSVDCRGTPVVTKKQIYAQAFCIYALSEYAVAAGNGTAKDQAVELFRLVEAHARDRIEGGYLEACASDWSPTSEYALSAKDLSCPKSMNTHLHILEAYTNLYRIWKTEEMREALIYALAMMTEKVLDRPSHHYCLFFDIEWTPLSSVISYGHDIEGSWLMLEAGEALGDPTVVREMEELAVLMADAVRKEGIDPAGGIFESGEADGTKHLEKDWWPQAEAAVGFLNAYRISGDANFLQLVFSIWNYIETAIRDRTYGEWYWGRDEHGEPYNENGKICMWKAPYHNSRACVEVLEMLSRL